MVFSNKQGHIMKLATDVIEELIRQMQLVISQNVPFFFSLHLNNSLREFRG